MNNNTLDQPVFVVGPLRSGTTLLRLLIGKHPDINIIGEFESAVCYAENDQWPDINTFHELLATDRQFHAHNFTIDNSLPYVALIKHFLKQAYDRKPTKFIGASVHSRMDLLPKIWPNAKYIHILRDPRDVASSCIGMGWVGNVYHGSYYWLNPEKHWDIIEQSVPKDQTLTVRYEELVTDPEKILNDICVFLDLPYSPEMIRIDEDSTYDRPSAKFANQWKRKLNDYQNGLVEIVCKDLMQKRNYEITQQPGLALSALELLKLAYQNRYFRAAFQIKRFGFITWLASIFSKRFGPKWLAQKTQNKINKIQETYLK